MRNLPKKLIPQSKIVYKETKTIYIRLIYNIYKIKKKLNKICFNRDSLPTSRRHRTPNTKTWQSIFFKKP